MRQKGAKGDGKTTNGTDTANDTDTRAMATGYEPHCAKRPEASSTYGFLARMLQTLLPSGLHLCFARVAVEGIAPLHRVVEKGCDHYLRYERGPFKFYGEYQMSGARAAAV